VVFLGGVCLAALFAKRFAAAYRTLPLFCHIMALLPLTCAVYVVSGLNAVYACIGLPLLHFATIKVIRGLRTE
jgi:hypothetical protein